MKLFNRVSRRIRSRGRNRPAVHLNFELCEDRVLLTNYLVNNAADSNTGTGNTGTLRYVLNQLPDTGTATNEIDFNIPGPGVQTISPASPLPSITVPVVINGYTQPGASPNTLANGNNAVLLIELNGASARGANGLLINAGGSTVEGLVINRFGGDGIQITGSGEPATWCRATSSVPMPPAPPPWATPLACRSATPATRSAGREPARAT